MKAGSTADSADLQQQVERLSELVASLQGQLAGLTAASAASGGSSEPAEAAAKPARPRSRAARKAAAALPEVQEEEPVEEAPEDASPDAGGREEILAALDLAADDAPEPEPAAQEPEPVAVEAEAPASLAEPAAAEGQDLAEDDFKPFDPAEFAQDFELAVSNPEPIDWALLDHDEEDPTEDEAESEEEKQAYVEMLDKHPSLAPNITQHNIENPPDFVVRDMFWDVVEEKEGRDVLSDFAGRSDSYLLDPSSLPFDQSVLEDLMAEAAMAEEAPPAVEPLEEVDMTPWRQAGQVREGSDEEPDPIVLPSLGDDPSQEALDAVPAVLAIRALALPYRVDDGRLVCRAAKPYDEEAIRDLREACSLAIDIEAHPISMVVKGLRKAYAESSDETARRDLLEGAAPRADNIMRRIAGWIGLGKAS